MTADNYRRCSKCRKMCIHPDYDQCESCEYTECPGCGEKMMRPGFCGRCTLDGSVERAVKASETWADVYGLVSR